MDELVVTAATHRGLVRESNQDRIVIGPWIAAPDRPGPVTLRLAPADGPMAVIDGMGGHAGGDLAAAIAAEAIASHGSGAVAGAALAGLLRAANRSVYDRMEQVPSMAGMGAAVACVAVTDSEIVVANVGDVRAYLVSDGYLIQLSVDDVAADGALTASLGGRAAFEPVDPHLACEPASASRVLVASDGLFGSVELEVLEGLVGDDDAGFVSRLIDAALSAGGMDNVSVAVVRRSGWGG